MRSSSPAKLDELCGERVPAVVALGAVRRRRHQLAPPGRARPARRSGTLWCHSTRSSMKETPLPLIVCAMIAARLAGRERHGVEACEQRVVVVAVDLDGPSSRTPRSLSASGSSRVRRLRARALLQSVAVDDHDEVVEAAVAGRHHRLPVAALLQLAVAEQDEDATRRSVEASRRLPCPTATGRPWPSGPVLVSTPGTFLRSGWPLSGEQRRHERVQQLVRSKKPRAASVGVQRAGGSGPCSG